MVTTKRMMILVLAVGMALPLAALAQGMNDNPECLGSACGKPKEEGGGGCGCGCGCSVWVAYTDDGTTLAYSDDADGDGKSDPLDNCPFSANRDQADQDADAVGDACDNCVTAFNKDQRNINGNALGDACDPDIDGDGILNGSDDCASIPNPDQKNTRAALSLAAGGKCGLLLGDACCDDDDADGLLDNEDNCPLVPNPNRQIPAGAICSLDVDGDNISDSFDNCLGKGNPDQKDLDGDKLGDACDLDMDNDAILNGEDNCALRANPLQKDDDRDSLGDACDAVYCYVVDKLRPEACLDPKAPFQISAGPYMIIHRNDVIRLPLFANRNGQGIEYSWTVVKRPDGSTAAIEHPVGAVAMSRDWQYAYLDGQVPTFKADVDGTYEFQVTANLVFADRQYPDQKTATSLTKVTVDGAGSTGKAGCSTVGGATLFGLLGLASLIRRRK